MNLDKLRDELAEKCKDAYFNGESFGSQQSVQCPDYSFKAGFDAALKALTDASGEFDTNAAIFESCKAGRSDSFVDGARWQFEECLAQLGLYLMDRNHFEIRCVDLGARIKALEARLAESERLREHYHKAYADENFALIETKDKLAASEARVWELEAAYDALNALYNARTR